MMGWQTFGLQFLKDFKFWLFAVLFFQVNRLLFILGFSEQLATASSAYDVTLTSLRGLQFDMRLAGGWALFSFLCFTVPSAFGVVLRGRNWLAILFVAFSTILTVVGYSYYAEYNDLFNETLFGLYYDDTSAIFKTIIAEYHLFRNFLMITILFFLLSWLIVKWLRSGVWSSFAGLSETLGGRIALVVVIVVFFELSFMGLDFRSVQLKDASVTSDELLNKAIIPPPTALRYAIQNHYKIMQGNGLESYTKRSIQEEVEYYLGSHVSHPSIDEYMEKRAEGAKIGKYQLPTHIFLIVMESYNAWPLLDSYQALPVAQELKSLAKEGLYFKYFLPASSSTMSSLAAIITGLPDAGFHINYLPSATQPYPSSITQIFKKLGYKTRMFYGGYLSWQKIGEFAKGQGFDEVYGAQHIQKRVFANEWGVDDESLFHFIQGKTNTEVEPTFTLVMSTSNHRPYYLKFPEFPLKEIPERFKAEGQGFKSAVSLRSLTHFWYADRALGQFVRGMEQQFPKALFAITGDHYGRDHVLVKPPLYESSSVPFVLYGKQALNKMRVPENVAGSHIDMVPTIVELIAPKGFQYHALGQDLLASKPIFVGIGRGKVITNQYIFSLDNTLGLNKIERLEPVPYSNLPEEIPEISDLARRHNAIHAIAWWRAKKGAAL